MDLIFPYEENMEAWHNTKVNKYMPLKSVNEILKCRLIRSRSWSQSVLL